MPAFALIRRTLPEDALTIPGRAALEGLCRRPGMQ